MPTAFTTRPHRNFVRAAAVAALALAGAAPVASANGFDLIRDCNADTMKPHYAASDYRDALQNMPADAAEYSTCRPIIAAAQLRDAAATGAKATAAAGKTYGAVSVGGAKSDVAPAAGAVTPAASGQGPVAAEDGAVTDDDPAAEAVAGEQDTAAPSSDEGFALRAVNGPGLSAATLPPRAPMLPVVLAFSIVVLGLTHALAKWGRRAERRTPVA